MAPIRGLYAHDLLRLFICAVGGAIVIPALPAAADGGLIEPYDTGWAISLDNDPGGLSSDQNYTGGIVLSLSGARQFPVSVDPLLGAVNSLLQIERLYPAKPEYRRHALQVGLMAFTPDDISRSEPIPGDHPYACVPFISNSRRQVFTEAGVSYQTTLMLGVLGTNVCETIQRTMHDIAGSAEPRGWNNQISDGGEPTGRWSVTRHQQLYRGGDGNRRFELTGNVQAAAGLTTHVGVGMNWRWGRIRSPWWSFAPHQGEYIDLGFPVAAAGPRSRADSEWYLYFGAMLRYRLYNGLLQGQFRDSEMTFSRSDLNPVVGQVWLGMAADVTPNLALSVDLQTVTRELNTSATERPVWVGITLRYSP